MALNTGNNIGRVGQFEISESRRILSKARDVGPFSLARVKQIIVDLVTPLRMSGFPHLSAAVITVHL